MKLKSRIAHPCMKKLIIKDLAEKFYKVFLFSLQLNGVMLRLLLRWALPCFFLLLISRRLSHKAQRAAGLLQPRKRDTEGQDL